MVAAATTEGVTSIAVMVTTVVESGSTIADMVKIGGGCKYYGSAPNPTAHQDV